METEKRIGNFRVNRKVAWSIFSTTAAQPASIRKAAFCSILADFVHSVRFNVCAPPPELFQAVPKPSHWQRILKAKPAVRDRLRPGPTLGLVEQAVAFDDHILDLAEKARLSGVDVREVLLHHPIEQ